MGFRDRGARPTGLEVGDGADSAGRRLWPRSWGCHWGCGGEAKRLRRRKKELRLGPRGVRHTDWKGEKGERERENLDKSEIRSESWKLLAKQRKASERVLWEICPERSILGNGGIRQPRLARPTLEAELVLASGGGRAPID